MLEVQATKTSVARRTAARTGVVVNRLLSLAFKRSPYLLNKRLYVIPSFEIEWRIVPVQESRSFSVEADYSPRAASVAKPIRILVYSKQCPHSLCWHWHEVSLLLSDAAIDPKQDGYVRYSIVIIQKNLFDLDFVVCKVQTRLRHVLKGMMTRGKRCPRRISRMSPRRKMQWSVTPAVRALLLATLIPS